MEEENLERKIETRVKPSAQSGKSEWYIPIGMAIFVLGETFGAFISSDPDYVVNVKDINKDSIPDVILTTDHRFSEKSRIYIGQKNGNYITLAEYFSAKKENELKFEIPKGK